jgi:hypothetical protein
MPDQSTSDQQVSDAGNSGQQDNWQARYNGLVIKVERLTLSNRDLTAQLETKSSENEQLRAQLSIKDTEKLAAIGERDLKITNLTTSQTQGQTELEELRALRLKVNVINEMKRPELLRIASKIPNMTDPEALKSIFADMASFADDAATERERQLKAGMTSTVSGVQKVQDAPGSHDAWDKYINSQPIGPEREKVRDAYWDWAKNQKS